jgi:hypothetical protein
MPKTTNPLLLTPEPGCTTRESNYMHEVLWVTQTTGEISQLLLINAHAHNEVSPNKMDQAVQKATARLLQFKQAYRRQYRQRRLNLER